MKKLHVIALFFALLCLFSSCRAHMILTPPWELSDEPSEGLSDTLSEGTENTTRESEPETLADPEPPEDSVVYRIEYVNIEFVSDEEKELWREPLEKVLASLQPMGYYGKTSGNSVPDDEFVFGSNGVGLIDMNCDGVPEVAEWYAGGSMGNSEFELYDLYTGEKIGSFTGGYYGDHDHGYWTTNLDLSDGSYRLVGEGNLRYGFDSRQHFTWVCGGGLDEYSLECYFSIATYDRYGFVGVDTTIADKILGSVDEYIEVVYKYMGDEVSHEHYFHYYELFDASHMDIPETAFRTLNWDDFEASSQEERAVLVADALLSSDQRFVKP